MVRHWRFGEVGLLLLVSMAAMAQHPAEKSRAREEKAIVRLLSGEQRVGRGFNLYSKDDERQMGEDAAVEIESGAKLLQDTSLTRYLTALGKRLAEHSTAREMDFRFKIIENDEINAQALPNGVVYVNTGLLIAAESEAELAAVIAHEIAHVAARHATRAATRRGLWGAASLGMAVFGGGAGAAAQPALGFAGGGFQMRFSRDAEREADVLGLKYAYDAGYDPEAFVRFLARMSRNTEAAKGSLARMNATHPEAADRLRRAERAIALGMPRREMAIDDTSDFIEARQTVIALTHPEMVTPDRPVLKIVKNQSLDDRR